MKEVIFKSPIKDVVEAAISRWYAEEGDKVEKGQDLVEINCDGASYILPAVASGILSEVYFEAGEVIDVEEVIAIIEEE